MVKEEIIIAIGIDTKGKRREFDCLDGRLYCWGNQLRELILPMGVIYVSCNGNQLTELIIPMGVKSVHCRSNQLTELILPDSVEYLYADKEVMGLEKYIGKVKIRLW